MLPSADEPQNPYEDAPWRSVLAMLAERGFCPTPLQGLSGFELRGRLWELLYAMAGKRLFFFHSDHLSDREFYQWLETKWLPGQAADLPASSEWNCHVDVSESGTASATGEELYLRYYADAAHRQHWVQTHAAERVPAHRALPHHRDQYLPRPHAPVRQDWPLPGWLEDWEQEDDDEDTDEVGFADGDDPLGLAAVDREIHRRAQPMDEDVPWSEGPSFFGVRTDETAFLRPIDVLQQRHYTPLPMAELTEETLAPATWELLHELSRMNFYVVHTDHLSDAELYQELTQQVLRQRVIIPELLETAACYHDCVHRRGDDGAEAVALWLTYYASEQARQAYARQHPAESVPTVRALPERRDWRLPQLPVRP